MELAVDLAGVVEDSCDEVVDLEGVGVGLSVEAEAVDEAASCVLSEAVAALLIWLRSDFLSKRSPRILMAKCMSRGVTVTLC